MTTEQKVLKQILKSKGKIPIQLIAKQLGIRTDYIGYLCKELLRKGLVRELKKRGRYKATTKGRKSLAKTELIMPFPKEGIQKRRRKKKKKERITKEEQKASTTPAPKEANKLIKILKGLFGSKTK